MGCRDSFPPLPPNFEADPCEPLALKLRRENSRYGHELAHTRDWTPERWREYPHTYHRLVSQADRALGCVPRALEAGGWNANTPVIFTSDPLRDSMPGGA